ncbi:MAG TPA: 2-C-methyl-D-erythritol 2,4-cyclodiphosphate synthase [Sedimentisphaerales bacterium]|nr:2-C-methyl-D-erythritol 2,4-cyclodiphosphate synthase [Sedimentisphaerales bacterium]
MIEEHDHEYRIGIGTDIHPVAEGRKLMLGGVYVPDQDGLAGHSDGDVAIHAIIDALLGASAMGDIGTLFPDTDPKFKGADSKGLLLEVKERLEDKRWVVVNIDLTIHAEELRLERFKGQIKRCIASLMGIDFNAVNVKAKTSEGLGEIGAGEAIAATAAVLLKRKYKRTL